HPPAAPPEPERHLPRRIVGAHARPRLPLPGRLLAPRPGLHRRRGQGARRRHGPGPAVLRAHRRPMAQGGLHGQGAADRGRYPDLVDQSYLRSRGGGRPQRPPGQRSRARLPGQLPGGSDDAMKERTAIAIVLTLVAGGVRAAEVTTNGTGGGPWSEAATWRGGAVPGAGDEVTIRKGDAVVFDRNDDGKTTCAKLFIDPQGVLRFKTGAGKVVLVVSGPVESFGLVKLDGTAAA